MCVCVCDCVCVCVCDKLFCHLVCVGRKGWGSKSISVETRAAVVKILVSKIEMYPTPHLIKNDSSLIIVDKLNFTCELVKIIYN